MRGPRSVPAFGFGLDVGFGCDFGLWLDFGFGFDFGCGFDFGFRFRGGSFGLRVEGVGFSVQRWGLTVWGSGCRVECLECRVSGLESMVQALRGGRCAYKTVDTNWVSGEVYRVQVLRFRVENFGSARPPPRRCPLAKAGSRTVHELTS